MGGRKSPFPLLWPVAYTTACTAVQAVISSSQHKTFGNKSPWECRFQFPLRWFPIPSHSHSQFCVLFPFSWNSHWIPVPIGNPIPMHISTSMTLSDLYPRFQGHDIIQCQITRKWHKIELSLQWPTNRKSHIVYRTAPFSMTLNDP